jgi:hypothetical protein
MINERTISKSKGRMHVLFALVATIWSLSLFAQEPKFASEFKIKDNKMLLILSKKIPVNALSIFVSKYNIRDIGLFQLIATGKDDSLRTNGWNTELDKDVYVVTKPFAATEGLNKVEGKIIYSAIPTPDTWRLVGGNKVVYGFNRFNSYQSVEYKTYIARFFLAGFERSKSVRLAGSFTNWQYGAFPMTKVKGGWEVEVKLPPGPYYYKFIADGRWMRDPANDQEENDGRGNVNSLVYLPNRSFLLKGYQQASEVFLAGTFNNWAKADIPLKKTDSGSWKVELYLDKGTYEYEYVVDGKSVTEDEKKNTVASIGDAHHFVLKGFSNAKKVALAGNFNDWKPQQLVMNKTNEGWVLDYVLGPGNYQYKFIVDGRWVTDPKNKAVVSDGKGNDNSLLIISPNTKFKLKGYRNAGEVYLVGEFSNWSERGLPMTKTADGWECAVFLSRGKHLYKFRVDGEMIIDPANKQYEEDERGNANSVMWKE